jgi:alkylhydroperoxidase/carboxymuconolactone decarboxylase family protein YurZ
MFPPAPSLQGSGDDVAGGRSLSPRDISLLNVAVAATRNQTEELCAQLVLALGTGVTPEEVSDILDQVALHAGHPVDDHITIVGEAHRDADGLLG